MENNYKEKYLKYKLKYLELSAAMGKSTKDLPDDFFKDIDVSDQIDEYIKNGKFSIEELNKYNKLDLIDKMKPKIKREPGNYMDVITGGINSYIQGEINPQIVEIERKITIAKEEITRAKGEITRAKGEITRAKGEITRAKGEIKTANQEIKKLKQRQKRAENVTTRLHR